MKMSNFRIKAGILSMCLLSMSALVITSAFGAIIATFPEEPVAKVQSIATIPSLSALLTTLLTGSLAQHFARKKLALAGLSLVALGGLCPLAWHTSVTALLASALIMGLGIGMILTLIPMLISSYFQGEDRAAVMGQSTAMNSLGLIIMLLLGSHLGAGQWEHTYLAFLLVVPIMLVVVFCLPKDSVVKVAAGKAESGGLLTGFSGLVYLIAGLAFVMSFVYTVYPTNLALVVEMKALGSTEMTGLINALGTAGGLVAGFGLRYINRVVKDKAVGIGFLALAGTFLLSAMAQGLPLMLAGAVLSGLAMAMVMATLPYYVSLLVNPWEMPVAMAAFQFVNSLGGILSPLLLAGFHVQAGDEAFVTAGIACLVVSALTILGNLGKRVLIRAGHVPGTAEKNLTEAVE